eukprot:gb/GEZN01012708.1/.p1 GENE.gb/GEZN01012708.1/~~gb/GEZN01012708.1/.p1  ORF type:complete len:264 (-),score=38.23 gb/GEZN01012708.1/:271-1035(-)
MLYFALCLAVVLAEKLDQLGSNVLAPQGGPSLAQGEVQLIQSYTPDKDVANKLAAKNYERAKLFMLFAIGGIAVLCSYVWAAYTIVDLEELWGQVPQSLRIYFKLGFFLASVGHFVSFVTFVLWLDPLTAVLLGYQGFRPLYVMYTIILGGSVMWPPLVARYLNKPSPTKYYTMMADLLIVGLTSWALLACVAGVVTDGKPTFHWMAIVGQFCFAVQMGFMDMIVWPYYFPQKQAGEDRTNFYYSGDSSSDIHG